MGKSVITQKELALARHCLRYAQQQGAQKVRITLSKSLLNLVGILNGEVDKVSHALDRSLQFHLFVDGRFGSFSSNRMDREGLEAFLRGAIDTVRMLEADPCRDLPAPERLVRNALTGRELDLYDPACETLTAARRKKMALKSCYYPSCHTERSECISWRLISEEGEYSDSVFDSVTLDSQGLFARHTETSFEIGYESTVEDPEGRHFSNYWWDASPTLQALQLAGCAQEACRRAAAAIGPQNVEGFTGNLIVESECAGKLVTPLLNALGGHSLQQKNSFLEGSLGQKRFPETLTVTDSPLVPGETGCRLYDSEGVATREMPVIEKGVVKTYFLNTYMSRKMNLAPTIEDASRITVLPTGGCKTLEEVLRKVGDGILVTAFNGGNSNPATGNFSYGVEGFLVRGGVIRHPVREMLITGNFLTLWNNLTVAAEDARPCLSKRVPTLAFKNVSFSA